MTLKIQLFNAEDRYVSIELGGDDRLHVVDTNLWELVEPVMDRLDEAGKFPIFSSDGGTQETKLFITAVFQAFKVHHERGTQESFQLKLREILRVVYFYNDYQWITVGKVLEFGTAIDSLSQTRIEIPAFTVDRMVVYP